MAAQKKDAADLIHAAVNGWARSQAVAARLAREQEALWQGEDGVQYGPARAALGDLEDDETNLNDGRDWL